MEPAEIEIMNHAKDDVQQLPIFPSNFEKGLIHIHNLDFL